MTHATTLPRFPGRTRTFANAAVVDARRRWPATLAAILIGAGLAGCTGSDPGIAFGPNGPVPSVGIASVSTSGAPIGSGAALQDAAAATPSFDNDEQMGGSPQFGAGAPLETVQRVPSSSLPPVGDAGPVRQEPTQRMAALPPASGSAQAAEPAPSRSNDAATPSSTEVSGAEVQFLPLIGVPQAKAELLARALSDGAAATGVTIRPAAETKTNIRLKGYFSAFNDGHKTTLVYVWDVLDANDQRTHRIQGQETVDGKADDPWAVVDGKVLDAVARRTLSEAASYG